MGYNAPMRAGRVHVALNAHLLFGGATYRSAGIHQYIANLLRHLPGADPEFRYTVFVGAGRPEMAGAVVRQSRLPTGRPLVRLLWEQFVQPLEVLRARPQLLHSLAFVSPLAAPCPTVVTVHDLSFMLLPDRFPVARRLYLRTFTGLSCRRARRVIAVSRSARADVARLFGVPAARIDVASPGVSPAFRPLPRAEVEAFRARRGLPERFILYLGTLEPRKGLGTLLRAFARLRRTRPELALVLAGAPGWGAAEVFALAEALALGPAVVFPGFVRAEELPWWYNAAAVFAYPSSYEGFGMPVAEALACARPVVASAVASLPEVAGEAALLVPPEDEAALAEAVLRALDLPVEALARGPAQVAPFTWSATAANTALSYRRALGLDERAAAEPRPAANRER